MQKNMNLGIVLHSKNFDFINEYLKEKKEDLFKQKIIKIFNEVFKESSNINQLMAMRMSQL